MNPKKMKTIGAIMWLGCIGVWGFACLHWFLTPVAYTEKASVRIFIIQNQENPLTDDTIDKLINSEIITAKSDSILLDAIKKLDLQKRWAPSSDCCLPKAFTLRRLEDSASIEKAAGSLDVIEFSVTRNDPKEAAQIANQIAQSYIEKFEPSFIASKASLLEHAEPLRGIKNPSMASLRIVHALVGPISFAGFILYIVGRNKFNKRTHSITGSAGSE